MTRAQAQNSVPPFCVIASGAGTNFAALVKAFPEKKFFLFTDNPEAGALKFSADNNIPAQIICPRDFPKREEFDIALAQEIVARCAPRYVILAGFMRILSQAYFRALHELSPDTKTINLHPAHREDYRGAKAYAFAIQRKFPRWGLSIHTVTPELDAGPLLSSQELPVYPWDNEESLHSRFRPVEHQLLIATVETLVKQETTPC